MTTKLTIGQLAKSVGVNIQTVRYYERRRLLSPRGRKPSGYRLYGEEAHRKLRFIRNAQMLGFTLREIAELLHLRVNSVSRCRDVQHRAEAKLIEVKAKVKHLQTLARALGDLIQICEAGLATDRCPILNHLERGPKCQRAREGKA